MVLPAFLSVVPKVSDLNWFDDKEVTEKIRTGLLRSVYLQL